MNTVFITKAMNIHVVVILGMGLTYSEHTAQCSCMISRIARASNHWMLVIIKIEMGRRRNHRLRRRKEGRPTSADEICPRSHLSH